jgi:CRISPR-associated protein Csb2
MAVTVAIRFPLGRFHATPWDRSVNEGAVEWPPSPWRLLRAIIATWYTRWPDLPPPTVDDLLGALATPPAYWTPRTRHCHTRHYLPDPGHQKGERGNTDLTLDPFLSIGREDELLVRWEADLTESQRAILGKLLELMPYLGRADSVCEARLMEQDPEPDDRWWRPGSGEEAVRLLAPVAPVRRQILEMSTVEVRKARRTIPPETTWLSYKKPVEPVTTPAAPRAVPKVEAIRLAVVSRAPVKATHGILLADEVHRQAARRIPAGRAGDLFGRGGAATDHRHAHWIPLADGPHRGATVQSLVIWVPQGLAPDEVTAILSITQVTGQRHGHGDRDGYEFKGLPPARLLLEAAGGVAHVAPELYAATPARRWRSLTPYLPVRHRKRESLDEYLANDVRTELAYRGLEPASVTRLSPEDGLPDRWARDFRRYRMSEHLGKARSGIGLQLEFATAQTGPILLGQLSHFGYGIFVPERE